MGDDTDGRRLTHLAEALAGAQAELQAAAVRGEDQSVAQWNERAANLTMTIRRLAAARAAAR